MSVRDWKGTAKMTVKKLGEIIGTTGDTGGTAAAGTLMAKVNELLGKGAEEKTAQEILEKVGNAAQAVFRPDKYLDPFGNATPNTILTTEVSCNYGAEIKVGTISIPSGCIKIRVQCNLKQSAGTNDMQILFKSGSALVCTTGYINSGAGEYLSNDKIVTSLDIQNYSSLDCYVYIGQKQTGYCNKLIVTPFNPKEIVTTELYEANSIKEIVNNSNYGSYEFVTYFPRLDRVQFFTSVTSGLFGDEYVYFYNGIPYLYKIVNNSAVIVKY